jgi:hypothetical protein
MRDLQFIKTKLREMAGQTDRQTNFEAIKRVLRNNIGQIQQSNNSDNFSLLRTTFLCTNAHIPSYTFVYLITSVK